MARARPTHRQKRGQRALSCPVTLGELFAGFARGRHEAENHAVFKEFLGSPRVRLASITMDSGEFYAKVLNDLRALGKPTPTNDTWIAACTMAQGAHLATADQHFRMVPGLLCEFIDPGGA